MNSATRPTLPDGAGHPATNGLDRALVSGLAWTGAAKWGTQILSWLSTLLVARLLAPTDFGLYGMALVYLGFVQVVNQFGLGAAILQNRDLSPLQIARLGGFSLFLATVLCVISFVLADPIANFFSEPQVKTIVRALSVTFIAGALEVVPRNLLTRDLEFRKLALVDSVVAIAMMGTTLALALLGAGYWSLIGGVVVGRFTASALVWRARPHAVAWPRDLRTLRGPLAFGTHIVIANVAWYIYRNADLTIVGRVLGPNALGAYSLGVTISGTPLEKLMELLGRVVPSVMAAVQQDVAAMRRYFLGLSEAMALVTFPAGIGLAIVGQDFVELALGPKWQAAVLPLRLLALGVALRSLGILTPAVMIFSGNPSRNTRFTVTAALVLPPLFLVGTTWGLAGVAAVWLIAQPIVLIATAYRDAFRIMHLSVREYLRALWPAASSSACMAAMVFLLQEIWPDRSRLGWRFAAEVAAGALVYVAVLQAFHSQRTRAFSRVLTVLRSS